MLFNNRKGKPMKSPLLLLPFTLAAHSLSPAHAHGPTTASSSHSTSTRPRCLEKRIHDHNEFLSTLRSNNVRRLSLALKAGTGPHQWFLNINNEGVGRSCNPLTCSVVEEAFESTATLIRRGAPAVYNKAEELYTRLNEHDHDEDPATVRTHAAIHLATAHCNIYVLYLLLKNGADPNVTGELPSCKPVAATLSRPDLRYAQFYVPTALHIAAENNYFDCAQILLKFGANPNAEDIYRRTPLHTATMRRNCPYLIFSLLSRGAQPNLQDNDENTALHYAAAQGFFLNAAWLLKYGADSTLPNREGKTPLDCAEQWMRDNPRDPLSSEIFELLNERIHNPEKFKATLPSFLSEYHPLDSEYFARFFDFIEWRLAAGPLAPRFTESPSA